MRIVIIISNVILETFIAGASYRLIGVLVLAFSIIMLVIGCKNKFCMYVVTKQLRLCGNQIDNLVLREERLLISVACLSIAVKIGMGIALFVKIGAVGVIAVCILLAFGYFFEGAASGMTPGLSYTIARLLVKIYSFISITTDKIAMLIAKLELHLLHIEIENYQTKCKRNGVQDSTNQKKN